MAFYSAGGFVSSEDQKHALMDPPRAPGAKVELKLSGSNLVKKDILSKSDPMCVVYAKKSANNQQQTKDEEWHEVGRTEKVKDSPNPTWQQGVVLEYRFEERQHLKFEVWDVDKEVTDKKTSTVEVKKKDPLGSLETTLGHIVYGSKVGGGTFEGSLEGAPGGKKKVNSTLKIAVKTLPNDDRTLTIKFGAKGLTNKDFLGKSDPFLVIFASDGGSPETWVNVGQTEVIKNNLNPKWKPLDIQMCRLINADGTYKKLRMEVYDFDSEKKRTLIGACNTDLMQLKAAKAEKTEFMLVNDLKAPKKKADAGKGSGKLRVRSIHEADPLSFLTSLKSGVALNFAVAIDFTASNGDPSEPKSLHHLGGPGKENQYISAIKALGEVLEDYDSDRQYPALGFGAVLPRQDPKEVLHDFSLSEDSLYCRGVQGVLDAYKACLSRVQLSGPTMFGPVINRVAQMAQATAGGHHAVPYYVLLILTDGAICDLDVCKRAIVEASDLPMSIVIVGLGPEDFSTMAELDSDGKGLKDAQGHTAKRDIVQFVEMRKFLGEGSAGGQHLSSRNKAALASEVFLELPEQISSWMELKKIPRIHF